MRQARESKHHLFTFAALAALVVMAVFGSATALADAGGDEYTLTLPGGSNPPQGGSVGGGSSSDSGASSSVSPATTADQTDTSATDSETATSTGTGGGDTADKGTANTNGKGSGSAAGSNPQGGLVAQNGEQAAADVPASSTDDGGAPIFLIVIAVVAAGCVALAVWRMRRTSGHRPTTNEIDPGAQSL